MFIEPTLIRIQDFEGDSQYVVALWDPAKKGKNNNFVRHVDQDQESEDEKYLARYNAACRTVFVGNLPMGITKQEVEAYFSKAGEIRNVQLIVKTLGDNESKSSLTRVSS